MPKAPITSRFLAALSIALLAVALSGASAAATRGGGRLDAAAQANSDSLGALAFTLFGRAEQGWAPYEPLIAHEIDSEAPADSVAFAHALERWQTSRGLRGAGVMDAATLMAFRSTWQSRRPFVSESRRACPDPPTVADLVTLPAKESYGGKVLRLRPAAAAAYARLFAAARTALPAIKADPRLMTLFSAFRDPAADAGRCARENNCQGITRAACSSHRTGLAVDIYLGAAPGFPPDSADDANRLAISRGAAYHWLVENAGRFGFTPYAFEPWHWEWTGEPGEDPAG